MSGGGQFGPAGSQGGGKAAAAPAGGDPSMEDILASIRRILSEDETPDPSHAGGAASPAAPPPAEDVLALDESMLVQEPIGSRTPPPFSPTVQPGASPLVALGSFMTAPTQPDIMPAQSQRPAVPPAPPPPALSTPPAIPLPPEPVPEIDMDSPPPSASVSAPGAGNHAGSDVPNGGRAAPAHLVDRHAEHLAAGAPLVGPEAAAAASASMGTLLRSLNADKPAAPTAVYRGGPTLEDIVRDEMRPMLKQWLDANLPAMVERLVRAEIERVAGRAAS